MEHSFLSGIEYTPTWLKKLGYLPFRYDVVWLLTLPGVGSNFLKFLNSLNVSPTKDPVVVEALAFEVEERSFNKHSLGSVLNISKILGRGTLFVKERSKELSEAIKIISNSLVDVKEIGELKDLCWISFG